MPINIDGSSVTDITIDGAAVTEVTIDGVVVWGGSTSSTGLNISASIYTGAATITLYEDQSGNGVADCCQEYTILDGTNTYDISSFDLSTGNDLWYDLSLDNGDVTEAADIEYIEVST